MNRKLEKGIIEYKRNAKGRLEPVEKWSGQKIDYKGHGKTRGVGFSEEGKAKCFDCGHEWRDTQGAWEEELFPEIDCVPAKRRPAGWC